MLSLSMNYIFVSRGCALSKSHEAQLPWDTWGWGSGSSSVFRAVSSDWGPQDTGNYGVIWDVTLQSTVQLWPCAPSSLFCLECPHPLSVPGTPLGSSEKPILGSIFCPCVRSHLSTGTATPRHDNLVSLIMAWRLKLIATRMFLISQNACYRKLLCKLQFGSGGSTQSVLIWPKW